MTSAQSLRRSLVLFALLSFSLVAGAVGGVVELELPLGTLQEYEGLAWRTLRLDRNILADHVPTDADLPASLGVVLVELYVSADCSEMPAELQAYASFGDAIDGAALLQLAPQELKYGILDSDRGCVARLDLSRAARRLHEEGHAQAFIAIGRLDPVSTDEVDLDSVQQVRMRVRWF